MALNRRSTVLREADWSGVKWIVASPPGYLIQILVPLYDNDGHRFPEELYVRLHTELMERFGGLTAHVRSPARGLWTTGEGELTRDDVAIVEVMTDRLDRSWWRAYRSVLEDRFRQEEMLVRALPMERL